MAEERSGFDNPWVDLGLQIGIPILGSLLFGRNKRTDQAIDAQTNLANVAASIFQQQAAQDLPYRKNLYEALINRSNQKFPRVLPEKMGPALNPFAGAARPGYDPAAMATGDRGNNFLQILSALKQSRQGR